MPVVSGSYSRVHDWTDDEANSINIDATRMDQEFDDLAVVLNTAFYRDGQAAMTGDLDMAGNKIDLDADNDTSIHADTDDQIDFEIGGTDFVQFSAADYTFASINDGTGISPDIILDRNSSSPADNDGLGSLLFRGRNDAAGTHSYAQIYAQILDASDTTEDGALRFLTSVAGTTSTRLILAQGLYTLNASGGDQGLDTINASDYYVDGAKMTVAAATDHIRGHNVQLYNGATIPAAFDIDAVIGAAFESVGPTGSGATNIWTELDDVPASAKGVILALDLTGVSNASGTVLIELYARPGDVSWAVAAGSRVAWLSDNASAGAQTYSSHTEIVIPIDSSDLTFDLAYSTTNTSSSSTNMYYRGFIY